MLTILNSIDMELADIEKVLLEQQDELVALESETLIHRPEVENLHFFLMHLGKLGFIMLMPILMMNV